MDGANEFSVLLMCTILSLLFVDTKFYFFCYVFFMFVLSEAKRLKLCTMLPMKQMKGKKGAKTPYKKPETVRSHLMCTLLSCGLFGQRAL